MADRNEIRARYLGSFLKKKRVSAGLTQAGMADALGYSTGQFVSNWERGVSIPPLDQFPKLATLLKIKTADLIEAYAAYVRSNSEADIAYLRGLFKTR